MNRFGRPHPGAWHLQSHPTLKLETRWLSAPGLPVLPLNLGHSPVDLLSSSPRPTPLPPSLPVTGQKAGKLQIPDPKIHHLTSFATCPDPQTLVLSPPQTALTLSQPSPPACERCWGKLSTGRVLPLWIHRAQSPPGLQCPLASLSLSQSSLASHSS